jgi:hypothetical protein
MTGTSGSTFWRTAFRTGATIKGQGQNTILDKQGDINKATIKELKGAWCKYEQGEIGLRTLAARFSETLGLENTMAHETARRMGAELKVKYR